jgi:CRP-like cAMP-binding protein
MKRTGAFGEVYEDGEVIFRQGDVGECMYVIQEGQPEVVVEKEGEEERLALLDEGSSFGEMAIFENQVRMATVRAVAPTRVLTVDKKSFVRRIHEDPSLAYRMVQTMSRRIRELHAEVVQLRAGR